jgi:integrase
MNTVQPIRDINKVKQIESNLKKKKYRDYLLFRLGIYSGYRVSDIVKLQAKDIRNKTHFNFSENKTGKKKALKIKIDLKQELDEYIKNMDDNDYLFSSQVYTNTITTTKRIKTESGKSHNIKEKIKNTSSSSPIQRMQAYRIINSAARKVGIKEDIGTHSMRKTFGYHFYIQYKDNGEFDPISILQVIFNHSSRQMTLKYIGIMQDDIDGMIDGLQF